MTGNNGRTVTGPLSTWEVLRICGFQLDPTVFSDFSPGLSFDFGCFKLSASHIYNLRFAKVFSLQGVLSQPRILAEVDFEMPPNVESYEQGIAWIAWHLGQCRRFQPKETPAWLEEGRKHVNLLPWRKDLAAYEARARCTVNRDWLRVFLKSLAQLLTEAEEQTCLVLSFDGTVLKLVCDGKVIATGAEGSGWPCSYSIPAKCVNRLPTRLMKERLEVAVFRSRLNIANWQYDGVSSIQDC